MCLFMQKHTEWHDEKDERVMSCMRHTHPHTLIHTHSSICVTWLIRMSWLDSCMCVTWLLHVCKHSVSSTKSPKNTDWRAHKANRLLCVCVHVARPCRNGSLSLGCISSKHITNYMGAHLDTQTHRHRCWHRHIDRDTDTGTVPVSVWNGLAAMPRWDLGASAQKNHKSFWGTPW